MKRIKKIKQYPVIKRGFDNEFNCEFEDEQGNHTVVPVYLHGEYIEQCESIGISITDRVWELAEIELKLRLAFENYRSHNIQYKYEEDRILAELAQYVDTTYGDHYATGRIEASEYIIDQGYGTGFLVGNILKYAARYGKKGSAADHRQDLMKVLHYGLMSVYLHDKEQNEKRQEKEHEKLSESNIQHVIELLNPDEGKPITKKEACEILNIAYNTTRLSKIIDDYLETKEYRAKRRADLRGKPATDGEVTEIVTSYLRGDGTNSISRSLYRSPNFVKRVLDTVGVPERPSNVEERAYVDFIPDECVSEEFSIGEIVWSAKYHRTAVVKARYSKEYQKNLKGVQTTDYEAKYGSSCYAIYVIEKVESDDVWAAVEVGGFNAFSLAYDLGKLSHLEEYGVKLDRI